MTSTRTTSRSSMTKPVFKPGEITKRLEIEEYNYAGVKVLVRIDYDAEEISLLEGKESVKKWTFAGRGLEYMQGWRNILAAMEHAIGKAEEKLKKHVAAKERNRARVMVAVAKESNKL